ncbi:Catenin Delta-2 [Manis pentadactyla]|nr:Catenin Delta-2 [Manis pentadactyla]
MMGSLNGKSNIAAVREQLVCASQPSCREQVGRGQTVTEDILQSVNPAQHRPPYCQPQNTDVQAHSEAHLALGTCSRDRRKPFSSCESPALAPVGLQAENMETVRGKRVFSDVLASEDSEEQTPLTEASGQGTPQENYTFPQLLCISSFPTEKLITVHCYRCHHQTVVIPDFARKL